MFCTPPHETAPRRYFHAGLLPARPYLPPRAIVAARFRRLPRDSDTSAASRVIESFGGGGPDGQLIVRGFFIGVALGIMLAMVFCCWWPCVGRRRRQRVPLPPPSSEMYELQRPEREQRRQRRREGAPPVEGHAAAVTDVAPTETPTQAQAGEGSSTMMTTATAAATAEATAPAAVTGSASTTAAAQR